MITDWDEYLHSCSCWTPMTCPIICGHRKRCEVSSFTLPYLLWVTICYTFGWQFRLRISFFHLDYCFLFVSFMVFVHPTISFPAKVLFTCPNHFSLLSMIFFAKGATFTEPLMFIPDLISHRHSAYLHLSRPHLVHLYSLVSCPFALTQVSALYHPSTCHCLCVDFLFHILVAPAIATRLVLVGISGSILYNQ